MWHGKRWAQNKHYNMTKNQSICPPLTDLIVTVKSAGTRCLSTVSGTLPSLFYPFCIPTVPLLSFVTMYELHPILLAKSSMAKQNRSHRANVICNGSPSRIRRVLLISLGMTTRPRSSDCVNQVQKIFVRLRKALKYKDSSAFGAFTPVLLIESF